MSVHATSLVYKEALSLIEESMPGSRIVFYQGFLDDANPLRREAGGEAAGTVPGSETADTPLLPGATGPAPASGNGKAEGECGDAPRPCAVCGAPTYAETCSYCRLKELVRKRREERAKEATG